MEGKVSATSTPCFPRLFPSPSPPHPSPVNFALTCLFSTVYRRSCCSRYRQWVCLDCVFDGIVDAIPPSIVAPKHSHPPERRSQRPNRPEHAGWILASIHNKKPFMMISFSYFASIIHSLPLLNMLTRIALVRVCARPVSPVTMLPVPSSVSQPLNSLSTALSPPGVPIMRFIESAQ